MTKLLLAATAAGSAAVLAVGAWFGWTQYRDAHTTTELVHAYDTTDPASVASHATDIFTGTVIESGGRRDIERLPSDIYRVQVRHVVKGTATGTITVTHSADAEHRPYTIGQTYLWATNPNTDAEDGLAQLYGADPRPVADSDITAWSEAVSATR
ncbi:hypothetical protein ACFWBC_04755 [Streptomyces sp. NPDC059985]|uniref:hypothetical protein n=1 Tax=Streptomyces sp. NPDC059985 TaxID=3347025 RepID=UPI0036848BDC